MAWDISEFHLEFVLICISTNTEKMDLLWQSGRTLEITGEIHQDETAEVS